MRLLLFTIAVLRVLTPMEPLCSDYILELKKEPWYQVLYDALETGMLSIEDISVKRDYIQPDEFRLSMSIDWLEKPFLIPSKTKQIADSFLTDTSLAGTFKIIAGLKDQPVDDFNVKIPEPSIGVLHETLSKLEEALGGKFNMTLEELKNQAVNVPDEVIKAISLITSGAYIAFEEAGKAYSGMDAVDVDFLASNISRITTEGESADEETAARLYGLSKEVKQQHIANGAKALCVAVDMARERLSRIPEDGSDVEDDVLLLQLSTSFGDIIVGGKGRNVYTERAFIIIDLGGNDEYRGAMASVTDIINASSVIIDLSGNDIYHTEGDYSQGAAICGFAILVDEYGDDSYTGRHHVQGSGTFGLGLLLDAKGIDRYNADTGSQGAGYWGYGIIMEMEGNDYYIAHMNSQGHAQVNGAGFLLDYSGNDVYSAGGKYKDFREGQKYYGSLSQGFAIGARPNYSAGIGGLFDFEGNDNYIADYFAQGSSYWFGIGILYDGAGDDRYMARRYSQGAGIHLSTGVLIDMGGNDTYISWGVSQGSGHDISQGILFDAGGNDTYISNWLSQGAGNANGFGILIDLGGNDRYIAEAKSCQGAGTYTKRETTFSRARGYTSIGILIDAGGNDSYTHGGENETFWRNGDFGVGYDTDKQPVVRNEGDNK